VDAIKAIVEELREPTRSASSSAAAGSSDSDDAMEEEEEEDPALPMGRKALGRCLQGLLATAEAAETLSMKAVLQRVAEEFAVDAAALVSPGSWEQGGLIGSRGERLGGFFFF
jgi:hypothetical protein